MKKLILSAAVAVLGLAGANAQVGFESVEFGVKAGYNLSSISDNDNSDTDGNSRSGFHAGVFAEVPMSDRFSIQPEVLYSTQGMENYFVDGDALKLDYINIPVLAKYYIADGFNVLVGPQIGFNVNAEYDIDNKDQFEGVIPEEYLVTDMSDAVNSTDFGMLLGLGYKMAQGLSIDARYNFGLTEISDNGGNNRVFQIGVGYAF